MSTKMENWKEKIKTGDITEAAKRTGLSIQVYYSSQKISPTEWTAGMARINIALKNIVEEREQFIADQMAM